MPEQYDGAGRRQQSKVMGLVTKEQDSPKVWCSTLAVTKLKKGDQLKMQYYRQTAARQQNLSILASNTSKYFQNTLKQQNYTKWNSKYWLPG